MVPTILIVDDDDSTRQAAAELLEDERYRVITAADGLEGQRVLSERDIDLLISDVCMPGLDGPGLISWLRGTPALSSLPVILWSGGPDCMETNEVDILGKPVEPDELLARIRFHLNGRMAR